MTEDEENEKKILDIRYRIIFLKYLEFQSFLSAAKM